MNMIEVDPKLFITCRLCLDEMGLYQIVPKVQMQIKYCFEIDVQPFDGLPQLICKKCEAILSQYAGIKQMYQVKQNSLKTVKKTAQEIPEEEKIEELQEKNTIQQQQDTVSSTQQVETVKAAKKTNKQLLSLTKKVRSVDCESSSSKSNDRSPPIKPVITKNPAKRKIINKPKKKAWASNYTKQFVCRLCSKSYSEKKRIISHINKHENLNIKFSKILNTHCEIVMNKVGSTLNLTNSENNVVLSKNKIINSVNSKYYILYTSTKESSPSESEESSDEELIRKAGRYKRQRLISEESVSSPINTEKNIESSIDIETQSEVNNIDCDDQRSDSLIDCVNIDSDSTSTTKVSDTEKPQKKLVSMNNKLITNIITMCYKKYLKRFDNPKSVSKLHGNMDSFLQHKVLSLGTKIIHSRGSNSLGLLRYLEHKNLDITWKQTKNSNSLIIVQTSLVNTKNTDSDSNDFGWRSVNEMDPNHTQQDFVDIFENLPPREPSPAPEDREVIEKSSQLNSNDNNIEKETSRNISPIVLNEKNKNQEKKRTKSYNLKQSTSMVTETTEDAVLFLRTALESDKQTSKKILNANPAPYPKQLPTKKTSAHEPPAVLKSPTHVPIAMESPRFEATFVNFINESHASHMPVITSTVSLATPAEEQKQSNPTTSQVTQSNKSETLPQIKVKPISELMPERRDQNNVQLVNMGWTASSSNKNDNTVLHATNANLLYVSNTHMANVPQYKSVATLPQYTSVASVPQYTNRANVPQFTSAPHQSSALSYPQILSVSQVNTGGAEISRQSDNNERTYRKNPEFVYMHTVELPNNKTTSPFRYFQQLLQIHNLVLLESTVGVSHKYTTMKCLIKFSLGFQQENNAPVTLCLTLYCDKNVFCIKVKDNTSKDIDVLKLSANWQWEILKVFKGDIVNKLNLNALKLGLDMSAQVNHFVSLLKAIIFSKEK